MASMQWGIHLPQYGRAAGPQMITEAARQAEDLGFGGVWVSDHVAVPVNAPYPPPFIFDPIVTLTWAAAATNHVDLGTSVLVLPLRPVAALAKELASLDRLSGGRLIVGAASGWLEAEFAALGAPFARRGKATDESIAGLRACWGERVVEFVGAGAEIRNMRLEPKPAHRIPIWVGGTSPAAIKRATALGDGWHGIGLSPDAIREKVAAVRAVRPDPEFTISLRLTWDGLSSDLDDCRRQIDGYLAAGVQQVVIAPSQTTREGWLKSVERLAAALGVGQAGNPRISPSAPADPLPQQ